MTHWAVSEPLRMCCSPCRQQACNKAHAAAARSQYGDCRHAVNSTDASTVIKKLFWPADTLMPGQPEVKAAPHLRLIEEQCVGQLQSTQEDDTDRQGGKLMPSAAITPHQRCWHCSHTDRTGLDRQPRDHYTLCLTRCHQIRSHQMRSDQTITYQARSTDEITATTNPECLSALTAAAGSAHAVG
jgi:hypothetical protein